MRAKPFVLTSFVAVALLSLILTPVAISSSAELWKEFNFYKKNYWKAEKVSIGPRGVNQLRSGKYTKKVEKRIYDFRKGDTEVYWVLGGLMGEKGYVTVKITTTRGTESNYEFVVNSRISRLGYHGQTKNAMPKIRPARGKIDHLLLIKRKMAGGYWYNPSQSVTTKVTFTYHPKR